MWQQYKIGTFNTPTWQSVSQFWFADLIDKELYRCEELLIELSGVVQQIKQLLEGSWSLKTEIKYKGRQALYDAQYW